MGSVTLTALKTSLTPRNFLLLGSASADNETGRKIIEKMTNAQLWIATVVPTLAVIVGFLLNHTGIARIENRLTTIEADLRRFYQMFGEFGVRITDLEKRVRG